MNMQERADRLVRNEVNVCLSALVATLAQGYGVTEPKREVPGFNELIEQAFDLCSPLLDWEEAATQAGFIEDSPSQWHRENFPDDTFSGTAQELYEAYAIEPYEREIFEHWSVSQHLADDLAALGERIDNDFAGMCVWGRTTTGQGIAGDSIIQRVLDLHDARYKAIIEEGEKVS